MKLSAIVCTRDRAAVLEGCLRALLAQADEDLEIVVVDNGSSDGTTALARELLTPWLSSAVITEERVGLSNARNSGIRASSGDIVAFIDDDARPHPGWVTAMRAAFEDVEVAAAGGPIQLDWSRQKPPWMPELGEALLTSLDLGQAPRAMRWPEHPYGANMAIRREVMRSPELFDPALGRFGDALLSGEESMVFHQLMGSGRQVAYVPGAAVDHLVPASRATIGYLLRRSYAQGKTEARMHLLGRSISRFRAARHGVMSVSVGVARALLIDGWAPPSERVQQRAVRALLVFARRLGNGTEMLRRALLGADTVAQ